MTLARKKIMQELELLPSVRYKSLFIFVFSTFLIVPSYLVLFRNLAIF